MQYMGGKTRIAKELLAVIAQYRKAGQAWVEPFCGGCNMLSRVEGASLRIANDTNHYLIALLEAVVNKGYGTAGNPFPVIDEATYKLIRANKADYPAELVGYAGFLCSYGSRFFAGYARDSTDRNGTFHPYLAIAERNILKQAPSLVGVQFFCGSYTDLPLPPESLIYCDPPYADTTPYKGAGKFDHFGFWQWCRERHTDGHTVFISEHNAPPDFTCIWEKEVATYIQRVAPATAKSKRTERLFTLL